MQVFLHYVKKHVYMFFVTVKCRDVFIALTTSFHKVLAILFTNFFNSFQAIG